METKISKDYYGWQASTRFLKNGIGHEIFTMKRHNGKIHTSLTEIKKISENATQMGKTVSYIAHEGRATQKRIESAHKEAIETIRETNPHIFTS